MSLPEKQEKIRPGLGAKADEKKNRGNFEKKPGEL